MLAGQAPFYVRRRLPIVQGSATTFATPIIAIANTEAFRCPDVDTITGRRLFYRTKKLTAQQGVKNLL